jgi:hypothetical protein
MVRVRSNRICFTINNYHEIDILDQWNKYIEAKGEEINYLVIGEEIGSSGTPHLQGFLHLKKDPKSCGIQFWKSEIPAGQTAHFENAKGTDEQNLEYCKKDGPYLEVGAPTESMCRWKNIFETAKVDLEAALNIDGEVAIKHYHQLKAINDDYNKPKMVATLPELRDWQKIVIAKLENQSERRILFVVDEAGGKGKSVLAKHLMTENAAWACQGGKINDLMFAYDTNAKIVIFDMARCNNPDYYPWNFMENLKNGWFTSTKYKGGMKMFPAPKIIVFMNEEPPRNKLSIDRYDVFQI